MPLPTINQKQQVNAEQLFVAMSLYSMEALRADSSKPVYACADCGVKDDPANPVTLHPNFGQAEMSEGLAPEPRCNACSV